MSNQLNPLTRSVHFRHSNEIFGVPSSCLRAVRRALVYCFDFLRHSKSSFHYIALAASFGLLHLVGSADDIPWPNPSRPEMTVPGRPDLEKHLELNHLNSSAKGGLGDPDINWNFSNTDALRDDNNGVLRLSGLDRGNMKLIAYNLSSGPGTLSFWWRMVGTLTADNHLAVGVGGGTSSPPEIWRSPHLGNDSGWQRVVLSDVNHSTIQFRYTQENNDEVFCYLDEIYWVPDSIPESVEIPTDTVKGFVSSVGTGLAGAYWKLAPKAIDHLLDQGGDKGIGLIHMFGLGEVNGSPIIDPQTPTPWGRAEDGKIPGKQPDATFLASRLDYEGNDLTLVQDFLGSDASTLNNNSPGNLDDGLFFLNGWLKITKPGPVKFTLPTDDGSVLWIGGKKVVVNDGSHGPPGLTPEGTALFEAVGLYPIDIAYYNGDWTNDAGDHGGAEFKILSDGGGGIGSPGESLPVDVLYHQLESDADPDENNIVASRIYFTSDRDGNNEIYSMLPDGSDLRNFTNNDSNDYVASVSKDGERVVWMSDRDGDHEIYAANADGSNFVQLTSNDIREQFPAISPDGSRIAYVADGGHGTRLDLYVMQTNGSGATRITSESMEENTPAWSPDGARLVYSSGFGNSREIFIVDADGSNPIQLTDNSVPDLDPSWSPDGSKIAFSSKPESESHVFTISLDGTGLKNESAPFDFPGSDPYWSPTGEKIIYRVQTDVGYDIFSIHLVDEVAKNLTASESTNSHPFWAFGDLPSSPEISPSDALELGNTNEKVSQVGDTTWFSQTETTHDGVDSLRSGAISHDETSTIELKVVGPGELSFYWKVSSEESYDVLTLELDGSHVSDISGEVDWIQYVLSLEEGEHTIKWIYAKDDSESDGQDAGWLDQVSFISEDLSSNPVISLSDALELGETNDKVSQVGDTTWFSQTEITHDGVDALRSGAISHDETSSIELKVVGPGELSFYWKVSSEEDYDVLSFEMDGAQENDITGEVDWTQVKVTIGEGEHALKWTYNKDDSESIGQDAGWLDQVAFVADEPLEPDPLTPPTVQTHPQHVKLNVGERAQFSVAVTGSEPLAYQWRKNGEAIEGAIASTYVIERLTVFDQGSFDCVVSNAAGSVTCNSASLTVIRLVQTITFPGLPVKQTTDAPFDLKASSDSGLPVSYVSSDPSVATISNGVLTIVGAGTTVISANQTGDATFLPANPVRRELVVQSPAPSLSILQHPQNQSIREGESATFRITATGADPVTYQWLKGTEPINGANQSSFVITKATLTDAGNFSVVVSDKSGSLTSEAAVLTVQRNIERPHPADLDPLDGRIEIHEITAYGAAWRMGDTWSVEPNPIPIEYVTRAAALWKLGEVYELRQDVRLPPLWWVSSIEANRPLLKENAHIEDQTLVPWCERTIDGTNQDAERMVTLSPHGLGAKDAIAIEEKIPDGWQVKDVSSGGYWDAATNTIRWGPLFGSNVKAMKYILFPTLIGRPSLNDMHPEGVFSRNGQRHEIVDRGTDNNRQLTIRRTSNGYLEIIIRGLPGNEFILEQSTDLNTWSTLTIIQLETNELNYSSIPPPTDTPRFLRLKINAIDAGKTINH